MKTLILLMSLVFVLTMPVLSGCQSDSDAKAELAEAMKHTAAVPIKVEGAGNLYKVSEGLYRSEQPTAEGFKGLQKLGIKTVVDLRANHSDTDELEGIDLKYVSIPMNAWDPKLKHVTAFLDVVTDGSKQPVLVHCKHGADRTGTMVAVYRMVVEDMAREDAIEEMTKGPFGYHEFWKGLPEFLEELNIEQLKKEYAPSESVPAVTE